MERVFKIKEIKPTLEDFTQIGFDESYKSVGIKKHLFKSFKIQGLTSPQANILKQTALSCGTDCAVHRDVITASVEFSDGILSGSLAQLKKIALKLKKQPFGLSFLADELLKCLELSVNSLQVRGSFLTFDKPALMGILNVTPDSFSDGGDYLLLNKAVDHFKRLVLEGAYIVDVGGESTRPGAEVIPVEIEISRILPVLKSVREFDNKTIISIDTRNSETAKQALLFGADIINDVSGLDWDSNMIDIVLEFDCPVIIGNSHIDINDSEDVIDALLKFFEYKVLSLEKNGFDVSKIILDPCLGFGKNYHQNVQIIKRVNELKSLGFPLLIGHSRKSFIRNTVSNSDIDILDECTLILSQNLLEKGVDILRVHNVEKHQRLIEFKNLFI